MTLQTDGWTEGGVSQYPRFFFEQLGDSKCSLNVQYNMTSKRGETSVFL